MKNLILMLSILFVIISCNKDDNQGSGSTGIVIKGTISGNVLKSAKLKTANLLSLSDAKKVLVFNSSGYKLFDINDSAFTAKAVSGTATALAFLDEENKYIGCLSSGGLNVLPLVGLKDGDNTIIDLSTLTLDGTSVIPSNNPIGNEINLDEGEIARYKELGSYYESLSKNIDSDNDCIPDILNKKDFNISTIFNIYCGTWGLNDSLPHVYDTSKFFINYIVRIAGGKAVIPANPTIVLTGPENAPYTDIKQSHYATGPDCFIAFFQRETNAPPGLPFGSAFLPFQRGKYTVALDAKNYTLNYSNISAKYFFILAEPTVHTNNANEIVSVSIEYRDMDNSLVNPENFVYQTMVQLNDQQYNQIFQIGTLWENPEAKTNTELYNFILPHPIPLSDLYGLTVCYLDLIGNAYNIGFMQ
jgi:hypothetical protein